MNASNSVGSLGFYQPFQNYRLIQTGLQRNFVGFIIHDIIVSLQYNNFSVFMNQIPNIV